MSKISCKTCKHVRESRGMGALYAVFCGHPDAELHSRVSGPHMPLLEPVAGEKGIKALDDCDREGRYEEKEKSWFERFMGL